MHDHYHINDNSKSKEQSRADRKFVQTVCIKMSRAESEGIHVTKYEAHKDGVINLGKSKAVRGSGQKNGRIHKNVL